MPSRVWISIPRHSLECFTRATRRVILCPPPSSSHAKDYRLFAHRPQSHVSPARISLRRMRSQVAQAQSSKTPLTMRCPGPDKVKEQEAMTGSMSGKEKHDAEYRQGSLPFPFSSLFSSRLLRPAGCSLGGRKLAWLPLSITTPFWFWHVSTHVAIPPFLCHLHWQSACSLTPGFEGRKNGAWNRSCRVSVRKVFCRRTKGLAMKIRVFLLQRGSAYPAVLEGKQPAPYAGCTAGNSSLFTMCACVRTSRRTLAHWPSFTHVNTPPALILQANRNACTYKEMTSSNLAVVVPSANREHHQPIHVWTNACILVNKYLKLLL